jgi:curved DNA-binding protein CbpA
MSTDLYAVLGVQRGSDAAEIRLAYRKKLLQDHPVRAHHVTALRRRRHR